MATLLNNTYVLLDGDVQWAASVGVETVDVGPATEQRLHHRLVPLECGQRERRVARLEASVAVEEVRQRAHLPHFVQLDGASEALLVRGTHRRAPAHVRCNVK